MIVVNFSTSAYSRAQFRLSESLNGHKKLMFTHYNEIGGPTHQESPYHFKISSIKKGFEKDDVVLWADSSMWRVGDLAKIEEAILRDGYFMEEAGHYVDTWCNDHTRKYFNLQHGNGYAMFTAGLLGLSLKSEIAMEFLYKWEASAKAGCFKGDWSNHRHDMTCGSIIANRMGLKYHPGGTHISYIGEGYAPPNSSAVFHCQGI